MSKEKKSQTVQTTGHAWDGDIQEFNNPLPTWWIWGFYLTVVFAIVYWFLYPAWPVGDSYTKGMGNTIEYTTKEGKEVVSHWTTRALYQKEMQAAREKQAVQLEKYSKLGFDEIKKDDAMRAYAISVAKVLFADNCAACHQPGGAGVVGSYPNLADDDWLWGGSFEQIKTSIKTGRKGYMPSFKESLNAQQLDDVSEYVLSLSKHETDKVQTARGEQIFNGQAGGCYYCHTKAGSGMLTMGSANLTDSVWTLADVSSAEKIAEKKARVKAVIANGVHRDMPAWNNRLTDTQIKILSFYVHQLGGGK